MSKILNRKMFSVPKQNHQGTGIVSGLEYRPGYRVGGRVGLKHGGPHGSPMPAGFVGGLGTGEVIPQTSTSAKLPSSTLDLNEILNQAKVMGKDFSIKPRDLSVFEPTAVDPIDYSKYSTDASKYLTDYNKYRPTAMDAIGKTAADTIEELEVIPGGTLGKKSTVATFAKNFQRNAASTKERRQELDLMKTKEKNAAKKLNDDQLMALQIKTDEDARSIQALNKKEQKEYIKMQMDEIMDSDIANKGTLMELYKGGVNTALKEMEIVGKNKAQNQKKFLVDRTMEIVRQNTQGAPGFDDLSKEEQSELVRFAEMDQMGSNQMTKAISTYNDLYMENYKIDPASPILRRDEMENKRAGLIQYMSALFPAYNFELIFPQTDLKKEESQLLVAIESFNPNLSKTDKEIINKNIEDTLFDKLVTVLERQKDGETFIKNKTGGTVPIEEVLNQIKSQIAIKYPDLNLGN